MTETQRPIVTLDTYSEILKRQYIQERLEERLNEGECLVASYIAEVEKTLGKAKLAKLLERYNYVRDIRYFDVRYVKAVKYDADTIVNEIPNLSPPESGREVSVIPMKGLADRARFFTKIMHAFVEANPHYASGGIFNIDEVLADDICKAIVKADAFTNHCREYEFEPFKP